MREAGTSMPRLLPIVILPILLLSPHAWAAHPAADCLADELRQVGLGKSRLLGETALEESVKHTPPRNQRSAEICWAYAECGLVEGEHFRRTGESVHLSPEYSSFYHLYFQLKHRLPYFRKLARKLGDIPEGERREKLRSAVDDAYILVKPDTGRGKALKVRVPDEGSDETAAFGEANLAGFVPIGAFDEPVKTDAQEGGIERSTKDFILKYMLDPESLDRFEGTDDDGINTALFDALRKSMRRRLRLNPPRPNDTFTYRGKTYTPLTFMKQRLEFDPGSWRGLKATRETADLALEAIAEALKRGYAVPIGFVVFDDAIGTAGQSAMLVAEKTGVFSPGVCPGGDCTKSAGGHVVLAVNFMKRGKQLTGFVAKNSWGLGGLDANARKTATRSQTGFYVLTRDYLALSLKKSSWDFVLPEEVANLPRFKGLVPEK